MEYMYYDADYGDVFVVCIRGNAKDYTIFSADVKSGPMLSGMWQFYPQNSLWQIQCLNTWNNVARNAGFLCLHKIFCVKFPFLPSYPLSFPLSLGPRLSASSKHFSKHNSILENIPQKCCSSSICFGFHEILEWIWRNRVPCVRMYIISLWRWMEISTNRCHNEISAKCLYTLHIERIMFSIALSCLILCHIFRISCWLCAPN